MKELLRFPTLANIKQPTGDGSPAPLRGHSQSAVVRLPKLQKQGSISRNMTRLTSCFNFRKSSVDFENLCTSDSEYEEDNFKDLSKTEQGEEKEIEGKGERCGEEEEEDKQGKAPKRGYLQERLARSYVIKNGRTIVFRLRHSQPHLFTMT